MRRKYSESHGRRIKALSKKNDVVSIAKKGKRSEEEVERESDPDFILASDFVPVLRAPSHI